MSPITLIAVILRILAFNFFLHAGKLLFDFIVQTRLPGESIPWLPLAFIAWSFAALTVLIWKGAPWIARRICPASVADLPPRWSQDDLFRVGVLWLGFSIFLGSFTDSLHWVSLYLYRLRMETHLSVFAGTPEQQSAMTSCGIRLFLGFLLMSRPEAVRRLLFDLQTRLEGPKAPTSPPSSPA